ncbi:MAG: hypothetical protein M5U26_20995 [Planctomycetota bacterium]|nr:hypothetical protein [Planctomycetota bacterium]
MVLLVSMAFQVSAHSTRAVSERVTKANVEVKGERTLKMLTEELLSSSNLDVVPYTGNTKIQYYVPIDNDSNGTVLQGPGQPNPGYLYYGVETDGVEADGTMYFEFIPERVLDEAELDIDLNANGTKTDQFDVGYIQRTTTLPGDVPRLVGVTNIVQVRGNYGAPVRDLPSTSEDDEWGKIFRVQNNGYVLEINLWLMAVTEDRFPHLVHCQGQVFLRNQRPVP